MALKIKKAVLWKRDLDNVPGTLAQSLKSFADAKINLQVVMGYAYPGDRSRSALEVYPVTTAKAEKAARDSGLEPMTHSACLTVEGIDRVGLAHEMAASLAKEGLNISFAIIQVVGGKFLGILGFESDLAADLAAKVLKPLGAPAAKQKSSTARKKSGKKLASKRTTAKGSSIKSQATGKAKAVHKKKSVRKK